MTFFYNLNQRLAEITAPKETLNEGACATGMKEAGYSTKAARAGKDIGRPGKQFAKIAKSAAERYGSEERGEAVAGAVLKKLRAKESVEESGMDEGNEFSGALAKARETGSATFQVDGRTYKVTEAELDEREFDSKEKFDRGAQPGDTYRGHKGTITKTRSGEIHRRRDEEEPDVEQDDSDSDTPKTKGRPQGTRRAIGAKGPTGRSKLLKKDYSAEPHDHVVLKNAYRTDFTVAGGRTAPAKTTNDLPMGTASPMSKIKRPPKPATGAKPRGSGTQKCSSRDCRP